MTSDLAGPVSGHRARASDVLGGGADRRPLGLEASLGLPILSWPSRVAGGLDDARSS